MGWSPLSTDGLCSLMIPDDLDDPAEPHFLRQELLNLKPEMQDLKNRIQELLNLKPEIQE
jgi:hypothetical protein